MSICCLTSVWNPVVSREMLRGARLRENQQTKGEARCVKTPRFSCRMEFWRGTPAKVVGPSQQFMRLYPLMEFWRATGRDFRGQVRSICYLTCVWNPVVSREMLRGARLRENRQTKTEARCVKLHAFRPRWNFGEAQPAGSCHRNKRTASEASDGRIRPLLS